MLTIWGRRNSFNVQEVMWLVGELRLEHRHVPLGGDFGGRDKPAFLAMNRHGLVPMIDDGGTVGWESHAILHYLAARHGAGHFWSEDPTERSLWDRWLEAGRGLQEDFLNGVFRGFYRTPETQRDRPAIRWALQRSGEQLAIIDRQLEGRAYLIGDELTLADNPAGAMLYRWFGLEIDRPSLPNVDAWYTRLTSRPAYREHVMVPFDDLKGRLDY